MRPIQNGRLAVLILIVASPLVAGCQDAPPPSTAPAPTIEQQSVKKAPIDVVGEGLNRTYSSTETPAENSDAPAAANTEHPPEKKPRDPIYIEEANGEKLIAAALERAKSNKKNVLIEWGGNWCGWCYKLHDVFHDDAEVHPIVEKSFELVLIDSNTNRELMQTYGGKDRQFSYPHLTILDADGTVLTNQETGSLEIGPKHDPAKVAGFLNTWLPK